MLKEIQIKIQKDFEENNKSYGAEYAREALNYWNQKIIEASNGDTQAIEDLKIEFGYETILKDWNDK